MITKFWWGEKEGERKIHWLRWKRLSKAKCNGGMGFREVGGFNKAMLEKKC